MKSPLRDSSSDALRVAVYGTLRRGYSNHDHFCRNYLAVQEIELRGRLRQLRPGIPMLSIPPTLILAEGTTDVATDLQLQKTLSNLHDDSADWLETFEKTHGWDRIPGELFTFNDAARRLPPLDRLEGFEPDRPSLYRRVLVPVRTPQGIRIAWLYIDGTLGRDA